MAADRTGRSVDAATTSTWPGRISRELSAWSQVSAFTRAYRRPSDRFWREGPCLPPPGTDPGGQCAESRSVWGMRIALGPIGVWQFTGNATPALAAEVERLGYGTIWIGGSPEAGLEQAEQLLRATERITVATGIVNMWQADAATVAASYHRLEAGHPGRFLLGVGVGHREATTEYRDPYGKIVEYLDQLDDGGVPADRRVIAALGPKVLELSAARAAGAHPYLTTPEHDGFARKIMGPSALLAPEHKVVVGTDTERARAIGRKVLK